MDKPDSSTKSIKNYAIKSLVALAAAASVIAPAVSSYNAAKPAASSRLESVIAEKDWPMYNRTLDSKRESQETAKYLKLVSEYNHNQDGSDIRSTPAVIDNIAFFGTMNYRGHNRDFIAYDAVKGKTIWKTSFDDDISSSPAVSGDYIAFTTSGGLVVLKKTGGSWEKKPTVYLKHSFDEKTRSRSSSPVIEGDNLYVGSADNYFYRFNLAKKSIDWKVLTAAPVSSSPSLDEKNVYFGSEDTSLYCLNKETGKKVWRFNSRGAITEAPVVLDDRIVFTNQQSLIWAVGKADGKKLWMQTTPWLEGISSSPAYSKGKLVISSVEGITMALDAKDGSVIWKHQRKDCSLTNPVIVCDKVVASHMTGSIDLLDLETGKLLDEYKFQEFVMSSPSVSHGKLYFGCFDITERDGQRSLEGKLKVLKIR